MTAMIIAMILQGKSLGSKEQRLFEGVAYTCGLPSNWDYIKGLSVKFQSGVHVRLEDINEALQKELKNKVTCMERLQRIFTQCLDRIAC